MMKEEIRFEIANDRRLFVHYHISENTNKKVVLFLNPLFDEKKRVQKFQADTARALCLSGYNVIRFDYYGTGDSAGETYDFDFDNTLNDIDFLVNNANLRFETDEIILLGIRLGGDLALLYSVMNEKIKHLLLIAPIVEGSRYLIELRMKRKAFQSLNRIDNTNSQIHINKINYEDFQGYLLSDKASKFLELLKSAELPLKNKKINIFQVHSLASRKTLNNMINRLTIDNKVKLFQDNIPEFWSVLEYINTHDVTKRIISNIK